MLLISVTSLLLFATKSKADIEVGCLSVCVSILLHGKNTGEDILKIKMRPKQSVTNIFEYLNVFVTNIYSDILSYWFFIRIYSVICSYCFLEMNIFGYSFVSKSYCGRVWQIFEYSSIGVILDTNIQSYNIRIVLFHTNIFVYSFV